MATSSSRPRDALTSSAPLYITIGPQCCGKTTFLKEKLKAQDISLDDQPDVYVPVPTQLWLDSYYRASSRNSTTQQQEIPLLLQQRVQGKSIHDRMIQDNTELNLILQRWDGRLSPQNFAIGILQHYASLRPMNGNTANSTAIRMGHMLVQVVEAFLSSSTPPKLPEQTQVFCLESLFRPHEKTKQSAIQRAHAMLRQAPSHIPIAWGNTNSKGKDYQQALEIACQTRRPVYFVLSHPSSSCQLELSLPWVNPKILLQRNLQRLCDSGKYIPANAILDCCQRIEKLVPPQLQQQQQHQPWQIEQALVEMASMQQGRRNQPPPPFRYRLTNQRLIQKQYPADHTGRQRQERRGRPENNNNYNNNNHRHQSFQERPGFSSRNDPRRDNDYNGSYQDRRRPPNYGGGGGREEEEERRRRWQQAPRPGNSKRGYNDDNVHRRGNDSDPNKRQRWG